MSISTIAPIFNTADWLGNISLTDAATGETFDSSDITDLQMELQDPETGCALMTGSITTGEVTVEDATTGLYSFAFSYTKTEPLDQGTYYLGVLAILDDGTRRQLGFKEIPVMNGIVGERSLSGGYSDFY